MITSLLRNVPLVAYGPLRQAVARLPRMHPARVAAGMVLRRALQASRGRVARELAEVRPIDAPELSFEPVNSMVVDLVYWLGVRGYEGVVPRVWAELRALAFHPGSRRQHRLLDRRPTLLIEVLPEATLLGTLLASLATEAGYRIHVLPEYGSDAVMEVPPSQFTSLAPRRFNSKDVVLSVDRIA